MCRSTSAPRRWTRPRTGSPAPIPGYGSGRWSATFWPSSGCPTAAFNRNLLARANRELDADFDLEAFRHRALWNGPESRMEMHLEARRDLVVHVAGRRIPFAAGETIHTENSRKFTAASAAALAEAAGWRIADFRVGPDPAVALALLET